LPQYPVDRDTLELYVLALAGLDVKIADYGVVHVGQGAKVGSIGLAACRFGYDWDYHSNLEPAPLPCPIH